MRRPRWLDGCRRYAECSSGQFTHGSQHTATKIPVGTFAPKLAVSCRDRPTTRLNGRCPARWRNESVNQGSPPGSQARRQC